MANEKKLKAGVELTDEELMEMTGGSSFRIPSQKDYFRPINPKPLYGIQPEPEVVLMYGIPPVDSIVAPKYGIEPTIPARPLYGIDPFIK